MAVTGEPIFVFIFYNVFQPLWVDYDLNHLYLFLIHISFNTFHRINKKKCIVFSSIFNNVSYLIPIFIGTTPLVLIIISQEIVQISNGKSEHVAQA